MASGSSSLLFAHASLALAYLKWVALDASRSARRSARVTEGPPFFATASMREKSMALSR